MNESYALLILDAVLSLCQLRGKLLNGNNCDVRVSATEQHFDSSTVTTTGFLVSCKFVSKTSCNKPTQATKTKINQKKRIYYCAAKYILPLRDLQ